MMHRAPALALALLCQAAHGKLAAPTKGQDAPKKAAKEKADKKADADAKKALKKADADAKKALKALKNACQDGEDCTSKACARLAKAADARKGGEGETCDAAPGDDATNPRGRNRRAVAPTEPFCLEFNDSADLHGFAPCPSFYNNVDVRHSTDQTSPWTDDALNPLTGDNYLWLRDGSGGSLACGTGASYLGDWGSPLAASGCRDLCFDFRLIHDGCHSGMVPPCNASDDGSGYYIDVLPALVLQGGPPSHHRAVFRAYDAATDDDGNHPGWRRICAPLAPLNDAGELPSNDVGYWYMAAPNDVLSGAAPTPGPPSPDSAWPDLLSDIVAVQLPIDFTSNPAERAGYDNICVRERDCEDPCDPEPLCYWQHEWDCKDAKKEEWYANFTALVSPLQTFPEKLCLCKILEDCCPDLCDVAEQELAALLLNVASGNLALDCGVEWCDDCVYNVSQVISLVDDLLAPSSRSDYDCSRALHLLTGINHDEILCDGSDPPDPCPQTDECFDADGDCVPTASCVPSPTVTCEDHFCGDGTGEECTCKMGVPCPPADECLRRDGTCVKNCANVPGLVTCKDLCDPSNDDPNKCLCEIKECKQTRQCQAAGGRCVEEEDCGPPFQCVPRLCDFGEGCVCKIEDPLPCKDINNGCASAGGECVKDCFPIADVRKCDERLCSEGVFEPDGCQCKLEDCQDDADKSCEQKGGTCKVFDDCDDAIFVCDPSLCGHGDKCVCEYEEDPDPCPTIDECFQADGDCVPTASCVPSPTVSCEPHFCGDGTGEVCTCKMSVPCNQTTECVDNGGRCVKNCEVVDGLVKCENLCDPDGFGQNKCECEIKLDPPEKCIDVNNKCSDSNGYCVPKCTAIPEERVCEPDYCTDQAGNVDGCDCQIDIACPDEDEQCKAKGGVCKLNDACVVANDIVCDPDLCGNGDKCVCEYEQGE